MKAIDKIKRDWIAQKGEIEGMYYDSPCGNFSYITPATGKPFVAEIKNGFLVDFYTPTRGYKKWEGSKKE